LLCTSTIIVCIVKKPQFVGLFCREMTGERIFTDTKHVTDKFYTLNSRKEYTKQNTRTLGYTFRRI